MSGTEETANSQTPTEPTPETSTESTTPNDSGKAEEATAAPAEGTEAEGGEAEEAAPLTVEDITIPEGFEVDEEAMGNFLEFANERGFDADTANSLVEFHTKELQRLTEASEAVFPQMVEQWRQEVLAFPEMAEAKRGESVAAIGRIVEQFGGDGLREAMDLTGAGDHPAFVRFMLNLNKALGEGRPVQGNAPASSAQQTRAEKLFGDMFTKD